MHDWTIKATSCTSTEAVACRRPAPRTSVRWVAVRFWTKNAFACVRPPYSPVCASSLPELTASTMAS
jgi:hypothetical protein